MPVETSQAPGPGSRSVDHWTVLHTVVVVATGVLLWVLAFWHPWGAYQSWLTTLIALVAFTLVVGHGVTGQWKGALIDERNRMSLSRLQLLMWTVVIVSAFATIAVMRINRLAASQSEIVSALDISVPQEIWILLGISTTSLIGSPLIKNSKKNPALAPTKDRAERLLSQQGKDPATVEVEGQLVKNRDISQARVADIFMGETVENAGQLEIGKIQMFIFTLLLVFAYAASIAQMLRSRSIPSTLPDVGAGMLALLGISHSAYLANKAVTSSPVPTPVPAN